MSSIHFLNTIPNFDFPQNLFENWTQTKVKKASLYTLASLSLATAAIIAGNAAKISGSIAFPAIPLALASGIVFWYAYQLIDYDDPKVLACLKELAASLPLSSLLQKHTFEKIFKYEILSPHSFQRAYRLEADSLQFLDILKLYKKAKTALDEGNQSGAYLIPHPKEWKGKFEKETKHWQCDQILSHYFIKDLETFELISSKQARILEDAACKKAGLEECKKSLEKEFRNRTSNARENLHLTVKLANLTYESHSSHALLLQLDRDTELSIASCRQNTPSYIEQEDTIHRINQEYEFHRALLLDNLDLARALRNLSIQQAENDFDYFCRPIREEIDARMRLVKNIYIEEIKRLTELYRNSAEIFSARS